MMKFNEKYSTKTFVSFLRDFLPEDYVEKEEDIIIDQNRYKVITNAKILGVCKSLGDLHVLEMDHTRNDPRVAIAIDAFKILADHWIHNALIIFKNNESENYRFSYLTINLDENDKGKIVKKYSNARRYSFYLGTGAKIKTPEQQLIKKGRIQDSDDLLNRFSLEVVNKQFYLEVAKYFDELISDTTQNLKLPFQSDLNIRKSFAVRLIGRTMFCWFLKQKKSNKGQLVPDELLSSQAVTDNYYHNILERLFFEVLNTIVDERDIRNGLYDQVPYLNGGLFSPQAEDYYDLDKDIGVSKYINTLQIKDSWFKKFFELLETYNFTIDENTVFDQELSVDPEMLGRIFENLLAEINPETGSSERKRTGSFYTPRQIVEYMVDQSLIKYLKTKTSISDGKLKALISYDEEDDLKQPLTNTDKQKIIDAVESLKILDPACGSGAFPIGALQKIVYILQVVDSDGTLWRAKKLKGTPELYRKRIEEEFNSQTLDYIRKLEVIKNSIFGVDIQPIAVEVSRLRCFLTLVVESEIDDTKKNRGIQALPNLDFKFVSANTLISAPEQDEKENRLFGDNFQENLAVAVDKYFSSTGANKVTAGNEIHKLIDGKVDEKLKHLQNLVSYNGDKKLEAMRAKTNKKEISHHSRVLNLWGSYKNIFENKPVEFFDTKYFFPSIKDGFNIVIGNPPYVNIFNIDDENYRKFLKQNYAVYKNKTDLYAFFIEKSQNFLIDKGILYFIVSNSWLGTDSFSKFREFLITKTKVINLVRCNSKVFEASVTPVVIGLIKDSVLNNVIPLQEFDNTFKEIGEITYEQIKNQPSFGFTFDQILEIKQDTRPLGEICKFSLGIKTSNDKKFISDTPSNDEYKKLLRGKDINDYTINYAGKYIWYRPDLMMEKKGAGPRNKEVFEQSKKILIKDIAQNISATLDSNQFYISDTINVIYNPKLGYSLEYILALLNSSLIKKWFKISFPAGLHIKINQLKMIPIPILNTKEKKGIVHQIEDKVRDILNNELTDAQKGETKRQIDKLIMDLYGLTKEEKEIIRKS